MTREEPLDGESYLLRQALASTFSWSALAWQAGGAMVAGLTFSLIGWLPREGASPFIRFLVTGIGFVVAYTILCAAGCLVGQVLATSGENRGGVDPLHFLVDNIAPATLLPLLFAALGFLVAVGMYLLCLLWHVSSAWQIVLSILSPLGFALVLCTACALFLLLFLIPAVVVLEQPSFGEGLGRLWRLFRSRVLGLGQTFVAGLAGAALLAVPLMLATWVMLAVVAYLHAIAGGSPLSDTARFVLFVYRRVLLWAPVAVVPLAFLNAFSLHAYADLVAGLHEEEEEEGEDDEEEEPETGDEMELATESDAGEEPPDED